MTSRPPGRRRVTTDVDEVIDVATAIANRDGLDALSIRAVATALDINPMSVYRFVESKDDLVEAIVVRAMDRFRLAPDPAAAWRDRVTAAMSRWRTLLVANPCVVQAMSKRRIGRQSVGLARLMETVIGALEDAGLSGPDAVAGFWSIFIFTFGHVVFEVPRVGEPIESDATTARAFAATAAEHGLPRVEAMAVQITATHARPAFTTSLDALLNGIVRG